MQKQLNGLWVLAALTLIIRDYIPYNWSCWITFAVFSGVLMWLLVLGIHNWKELRGKALIGIACIGVVLAFFVGKEQYKEYEAVASIEQSFSEKRDKTREEYGRSRLQDADKMQEECYEKCEPCARECDEEYQRKVEETRHISKDSHDPKMDCCYLRELASANRAACKAGCTADCYAAYVKRIREIHWWIYAYQQCALGSGLAF